MGPLDLNKEVQSSKNGGEFLVFTGEIFLLSMASWAGENPMVSSLVIVPTKEGDPLKVAARAALAPAVAVVEAFGFAPGVEFVPEAVVPREGR